ncbi:MAG TPA: PorP/SprF family type IX secretion system membrane protein [Chryseosolibacter sp.]|nr:PorP/SprF family type IX secretion system membrane protein [Chryseosolibacter sp.]
MIQRSLLVSLLVGATIFSLQAQDQANFTQFYLNPYILNPSYVGMDGKTSMSLIYRRQWADIDGAPSIANFSLHTPINPRTSTGFAVTNDKRGLLSKTSLVFTFGYNIKVQEHSFVRFGISGGGTWNTLDMEKLGDFTDNALLNVVDNHATVAGNAGVSFHSRFFHIGASIPQIFSPSVLSEDGFKVSEVKPFETILAHASNRFYFNDNKNIFEPYVIYRLNASLPSQMEAAGILHLNHVIWLGGSYKQDFGISALGGIKLNNTLAIGASYSLKNSGENQLNSPTFEVSLNLLFGVHKKNTPMYSFVDTHREKEKKPVHHPTQQELAEKKRQEELKKQQLAEAEAKKKADAEALKKKHEEELAKHQEEVQKRIEARKNEVVKPPEPKKDTVVAHNPRFNQEMNKNVQPVEGHHEHEQEQLSRLEIHAENPTEEHKEEGHPNAERHEFYKKGNHAKELDVSDYVIGGVFKSEANAKHFSDGLDKLGFDTHYGHLTEKSLWYVYIIKTDDINKARAERDRARKMKILRDAWLLTVHH